MMYLKNMEHSYATKWNNLRETKQFGIQKHLKQDIYVDDLLSGARNLQEAMKLQSELQIMCESGKLLLRKWYSNVPELLLNVLEHCRRRLKIFRNCWDADRRHFQV